MNTNHSDEELIGHNNFSSSFTTSTTQETLQDRLRLAHLERLKRKGVDITNFVDKQKPVLN